MSTISIYFRNYNNSNNNIELLNEESNSYFFDSRMKVLAESLDIEYREVQNLSEFAIPGWDSFMNWLNNGGANEVIYGREAPGMMQRFFNNITGNGDANAAKDGLMQYAQKAMDWAQNNGSLVGAGLGILAIFWLYKRFRKKAKQAAMMPQQPMGMPPQQPMSIQQ